MVQSNMTKQQFVLDLTKSLLTSALSAPEFASTDGTSSPVRMTKLAKDALSKAAVVAEAIENAQPDIFNNDSRVIL